MKKTLQAAALLVLAALAVAAVALSPHSRANNQFVNEWEKSGNNSTLASDPYFIHYSKTTK